MHHQSGQGSKSSLESRPQLKSLIQLSVYFSIFVISSSGHPHLCHSAARSPTCPLLPAPDASGNARWAPARCVATVGQSLWHCCAPGWLLWQPQRSASPQGRWSPGCWSPRAGAGTALRCSAAGRRDLKPPTPPCGTAAPLPIEAPPLLLQAASVIAHPLWPDESGKLMANRKYVGGVEKASEGADVAPGEFHCLNAMD